MNVKKVYFRSPRVCSFVFISTKVSKKRLKPWYLWNFKTNLHDTKNGLRRALLN